jgi:hypothetical protein
MNSLKHARLREPDPGRMSGTGGGTHWIGSPGVLTGLAWVIDVPHAAGSKPRCPDRWMLGCAVGSLQLHLARSPRPPYLTGSAACWLSSSDRSLSSPGQVPVSLRGPAAALRSSAALTKAKIAPWRAAAKNTSGQLRAASVAFGTSPICSAARFISSRCVHCTCLPLRPAPDHRQGHCLVGPRAWPANRTRRIRPDGRPPSSASGPRSPAPAMPAVVTGGASITGTMRP